MAKRESTPKPGTATSDYATIGSLLAAAPGGKALLGEDYLNDAVIERDYRRAIRALSDFPFWTAGATGNYRPTTGLWAPQRKAVAFAHAYLACQRRENIRHPGSLRESALVKMPTGTGKTGVIATLACCASGIRRIIVLTPRKALVEQMLKDLSWRFWKRFGYCYIGGEMRRRVEIADEVLTALEKDLPESIEVLRNDGYRRIWANRDGRRQVIVGTFNALHATLGLEPPVHRSMQGRAAREPAASLAECKSSSEDTQGVENFRKLLRETDLLIVDEGHYEPAFSWAQCVNAIDAPTIIFSATPYRNDYKYFKMYGNFAFNLPFEEAVDRQLIRQVVVDEQTVGSKRSISRDNELAQFVRIVRERCQDYPDLPQGRPAKCIVHGATYETLKRLQCEFYRQDRKQLAVLIHDAHSGPTNRLNGDLRKLGKVATSALAPYRFEHVSDAVKPDGPGPQARVWLHQYKLLEGIDNADFIEVFLFDGFRNARQLVQQVGRALRYADESRSAIETARVFGAQHRFDPSGSRSVHAVSRQQWLTYLGYEEYAAREPQRAFTAETQLLTMLKKTAPDWQYFAGGFRKGFFTDENATIAEYVVPRRAVVCHYQPSESETAGTIHEISDEALDHIVKESTLAFQLEDRFDIRAVSPPPGEKGYEDVRLIRYLAWSNSKLLLRQSLPEWKLGVMAIVRANPYLFLIDTGGVCLDFERLHLFSPSPEEMKRLFSENELDASGMPRKDRIRIVEASAVGLDLSEISIRSMTIRKRNLNDGYFDLAEASQAPSAVHGIALLGDKTTRRQLSIRRGRLVDPTTRNVTLKDYAEWARLVARALLNAAITPHPFFRRFALEASPPPEAAGKAQSLLLDIWELLNTDDVAFSAKEWDAAVAQRILDYDMCMEAVDVSDEQDGSELAFMLGGKYEIRVKYVLRKTIPPRGRYSLSCGELDAAIVSGSPTTGTSEISPFGAEGHPGASLIGLINQKQCFRVIPAEDSLVYANGVFFRPSIDWNAVAADLEGNLLDVITIAPSLAGAVSEKGESGVTRTNWRTKSQFGLIVEAFRSQKANSEDTMLSEIATYDVLVCDDGSSEIGDFLCLDLTHKKVTLIHAKAKDDTGGVSVDKLQIVGRQASASLAFVGSTRSLLPYPTHWENELVIRNRDSSSVIRRLPRVHCRKAASVVEVHGQIVSALRDPTYRREVWVITSGLFSRSKAVSALGGEPRKRGALQFAYYLADLRTAFGRAGVGLRIFTGE